jgi:uncharacterized membrane protein YdbT with pleckstrin-like domain
MGYVDRVLQPGEKIRMTTTVSWTTYIPGALLCILGLIIFFIFFIQPGPDHSHFLTMLVVAIAILLFLVGSVLAVRAWFRRMTTEVAVTDRRIIFKRGFVNRHTVEMHMDKVESVDVNQSILGRIFNYGDIVVHGTGDSVEPLRAIDRPIEFRSQVTAV